MKMKSPFEKCRLCNKKEPEITLAKNRHECKSCIKERKRKYDEKYKLKKRIEITHF